MKEKITNAHHYQLSYNSIIITSYRPETFISYETQTSHAICKASNKGIEQI